MLLIIFNTDFDLKEQVIFVISRLSTTEKYEPRQDLLTSRKSVHWARVQGKDFGQQGYYLLASYMTHLSYKML